MQDELRDKKIHEIHDQKEVKRDPDEIMMTDASQIKISMGMKKSRYSGLEEFDEIDMNSESFMESEE